MEYKIKSFLPQIGPKILQRGEDYYYNDMVKNLQKSGGEFTAEVEGSEYKPYHVEISFDEDGEVEAWECSCPYDWGAVCKHVAAVLLAIEQDDYEELPEGSADKMEELVNQADSEVIKRLILEQCKRDQRFCLEVLSTLDASGQEELAAVKKRIKASAAERYNYYDDYYGGRDTFCQDVQDSLEKARRRMERKEYALALDILQYLLTTCMELLRESYDESDLPDSIDTILDYMKKCAFSMAEGAKAAELRRQLDDILAAADSDAFYEWDEYRYDLLQCAAPLADKESVKEIYDLLDKWDASPDSEYYTSKSKETRYCITARVDGLKTARVYLEQNLDVDKLRTIAIRQDMEQKNYANAERLCLEALDSDERKIYYHPDQWNYLLYEIYEKWGNREKRILQARQLVLLGDWSYYKIYKEAMLASGQWETAYPKLRDQVRTARPSDEYMRMLSDEQEVDLLMEQVRLYPDAVFQYGDAVAPQYGAEVYAICMGQIREKAQPVTNRERYQELCRMIQLLHNLGGQDEALNLIDELVRTYPRRRAMLEELKKTRLALFL